MRAVQITRFGGPEVLDVVDLPDPVPGDGQQLFDVSTAVVANPDLVKRIARDHDTFINHTYDHRSFTGLSTRSAPLSIKQRVWEIKQADRQIVQLTGNADHQGLLPIGRSAARGPIQLRDRNLRDGCCEMLLRNSDEILLPQIANPVLGRLN